jgi:AcrR family transcriptional regulator
MAQKGRKNTQRERLLAGMVTAANRGGYAGATVSAVVAEAGVTRPAFYSYFKDRDACFVSCVQDVHAQLLGAVAQALAQAQPQEAIPAAVATTARFASEHGARARFLMSEALGGGHAALDARDGGIARLAAAVEARQRQASTDAYIVDLSPRLLLGGLFRMIAMRLRRGEVAVSRLTDDLAAWLSAYVRSRQQLRWQSLSGVRAPARSLHGPVQPMQRMPGPLSPGRASPPAQEVSENHRLRILYAATLLAWQKGYAQSTVADVLKLASIDGQSFYRLFSDKQEAFTAAHQLAFQQLLDVTTRAFFSQPDWPQRSWEAARALAQALDDNPAVADIAFVQAHALGERAVAHSEESHTALTFFLQEGLLQRQHAQPASRVAMDAIVACLFELIYLQIRSARSRAHGRPRISTMLAHIMHVWLTPFLGGEQSDAFSDERLRVRAGQAQLAPDRSKRQG